MSAEEPSFESSYSGAGILVHGVLAGTPYFLLGAEKSGLYEDFGGARDRGEKDPRVTASRECAEESAGTVNVPASDLDSAPALVYAAHFYQFWIRSDALLGPGTDDLPHRFLQARSMASDDHCREKHNLKWIPVTAVRDALGRFLAKSGDPPKFFPKRLSIEGEDHVSLRKHLVKMLSKAEEMGLLQKLCEGKPLS